MQLTEKAIDIYNQTLSFVDPEKILPDILNWSPDDGELTVMEQPFSISNEQPIYIIGAGKAAVPMAKAVETIFGDRIADGIVIAPDDYKKTARFQVFKGSHPLPDKESLSSSYELVSFVKKIPDNATVISLISGGTSSLFCLPAGDLEIEEVREIYSLLIESGAGIHEINTVRKVFSSVKGGQMLQYLKGKQVIDLMISDITDDDIRMIGSGPTIAQEISATDAFQILKRYKLYNAIPHAARQFLALEMDREMSKNTYRHTEDIDRHTSFIIASASKMARHAADIAEDMGFSVTLNEDPVTVAVDKLVESLVSQIRESETTEDRPSAIVSFGEPTVHVTGDGLGGRNQELALRMAVALQTIDQDVAFLSAGTDGIDGPTDAAGAVITQNTYQSAIESDINPVHYLQSNDSYHFFLKAGGHIKPGPTGNNLMDLHVVLIR